MEMIKKVYKSDNRPWVVGYSGGKDSTTVAQLTFYALMELEKHELHKPVYIISSDTLIEIPPVLDFLSDKLVLMEKAGQKLQLPIHTKFVKPNIDNTFWVLLIGKGYPNPRSDFRWCTSRLKIDPANEFIENKVSEHGEVITVLGVRQGESRKRDESLSNHRIDGKILKSHSSLTNAFVFAPIENYSTDDVWEYLLKYDSPWGSDNGELLALYESAAGECPLVVDRGTPSCGNSRFGCWICTVVAEDKALIGMIESGERWLIPLLRFRKWLEQIRDDPKKRMDRKRSGKIQYKRNSDLRSPGPYTLETRKEIYQKLLETQQEICKLSGQKHQLIGNDEFKKIKEFWDIDENLEYQTYQEYLNTAKGVQISLFET